MSKMSGHRLCGMTYSGRKDFTSFAGLTMWVDPRVTTLMNLVQNAGSTYVQSITDRTGNYKASNSGNTKPLFFADTFNYIRSYNLSSLNIAPASLTSLAFLADGSPFSIFSISRVASGASGGSNVFTPLVTNRTGGFLGRAALTVGSTERRVRVQQMNNAGASVLSVSSPIGSWNYDTNYLFEWTVRGYNVTGNDAEVLQNGLVVGSGNYTGLPTGDTITSSTICAFVGAVPSYARNYLTLVYNHTGKSLSQIDADRAEITGLIQNLFSPLF